MRIVSLDNKRLREIVDMANRMSDAVVASGHNHCEEMAERFAEADLVWGVFPDPGTRGGVSAAILKGEGLLMLVSQGKKAKRVGVAAFRFREEAEAEAACQVWGDDRAKAA